MRTLVVAGEYPWPDNSGSRLRLATVLAGLSRCGPVDLFSVLPTARNDIDPPPPGAGVARVGHVAFDDRPPTGIDRLVTAVRGAPFELPRPDGGAALQALTRFAHGRYDLVWYFGMRPLLQCEGMVGAPGVLDLVDLEDHKITARMAIPPDTAATGTAARARRAAARAFSAEEVRRWRRLQRAAGSRVAATVVCSELDAERARAGGVPRVEVVPNAYRLVPDPVGRTAVGDPPVVLFQGTLRYPPNAEAARFLVRDVVPELVARVPGVRVRLVGTPAPGLAGLDDPPTVTLVGQVPDMADELAGADVVLVPLRFGSGTRLKVLEAFAQRVPVVSTTLGAEGLGAEDGVHLLVADSADGLAAATARLLGDEALRARLVDAAHELFAREFAEEVVAARVADVAVRVAGAPV